MDRDHRGYDVAGALIERGRNTGDAARAQDDRLLLRRTAGLAALSAQLDAVIDAANRANVTTYADRRARAAHAKGTADVKKEMDVFVDDRVRSARRSASERTQQPLTMAFERVEDTLRLDISHRAGAAVRMTPAASSSKDRTICRRHFAASTRTTSSTTCSPTRR